MKTILRAIALCTLALLPSALQAAFDHSAYDKILRRYVNEAGLVNYQALRQNALPDLQGYLQRVAQADLKGASYQEKLAFWINAYNAHMIQHILNNPKLKKVSENFGLFDLPVQAAGLKVSLNDIENRIIRGKVNSKNKQGPLPGVTLEKLDPRIHFALVCAAVDCPKLRHFAYTPQNVEATLQENAVIFANSPKHVSVQKGRLRLSTLMQWYGEDFNALGGVPAYLAKLTDPQKRPDEAQVDELLRTAFGKAAYEYDWTVNDVNNAKK